MQSCEYTELGAIRGVDNSRLMVGEACATSASVLRYIHHPEQEYPNHIREANESERMTHADITGSDKKEFTSAVYSVVIPSTRFARNEHAHFGPT